MAKEPLQELKDQDFTLPQVNHNSCVSVELLNFMFIIISSNLLQIHLVTQRT